MIRFRTSRDFFFGMFFDRQGLLLSLTTSTTCTMRMTGYTVEEAYTPKGNILNPAIKEALRCVALHALQALMHIATELAEKQ